MSHNIIDPDLHFIIDADDRSITNETGQKLTIMQYDHNSERATFELPRYIEDHDMYACDLVMVLFTNTSKGTSSSNRSTSSGVYQVTDLAIKQDYPDTLTCSWLIAREATQYVGTLKFQLQFVCHENEDKQIPEYYWHTDQCDMIEVKASLSSGNDVGEAYPDILTSMDARVSVLEKNGVPDTRLDAAIDEYLVKHPIEKVTEAELRTAIEAYFVDNPVAEVTDEHIEAVIAQYLKDHPVSGSSMSTQEFNTRTENYISTRPMDSKTEDEVNKLIKEYLDNNPVGGEVSQEELQEAIRLYFIDYPVPGVTEEALAEAIENYFIDNPISGGTGGGQLPWEYYANMLTTSRKIQKYENGDTSDDIFIRAEGAELTWYRAIYDGGDTVLQNLYWVDADHTALTGAETDYPVRVYTYEERIRMGVEITSDETHSPKWTFGEGYGYDNPDQGKFYMEKLSDMMKMYLLNDANKEIGISISNNYTDITGIRRLTSIAKSGNTYTMGFEGGVSVTMETTVDENGNVTGAVLDGSHTISISGV